MDSSGLSIPAQELTDSSGDDAQAGLDLMHAIDSDIVRIKADAACDMVAIHEAAAPRETEGVVPHARTDPISKR